MLGGMTVTEDLNEVCAESCVHEDKVRAVQEDMPAIETIYALADIFKTLGDPTRIKLLFALMQQELCVCDLAALIEVSESAVSHQLRVLRGQKLVRFRRDGKNLYYSLDDEHVRVLFAQGLDHVQE